ncbi:hypothetical protein [Phycisphaera mikurensis]|uniref:Uncharacterized protein n=1 Tax=Phycisphaera mikurensis (strain NBRC 102666 / KCTC 22515 / FYK2301M01) TaxID=1142394 RepID=I0II21_PHYMF|nr:hypothetical protein [Phycisphaera mikurensis]MBB6442527.1 hypothetical protein [Phycisphaera mikurensis]BAM04909.1 hypothetical protein PSMK_27500 [Phycisphaera mikurensis NBRC 102666]
MRPLALTVAVALAVFASAPAASGRSGFLSIGGDGERDAAAGCVGGFGLLLREERLSAVPSWYAWFETRRDGFLADRWPGGSRPEPGAAWVAARDDAAEALAAAWEERAAAPGGDAAAAREREAALVLALGRVGGPRAESLLAADDGPIASPSPAVRGMTRLARGLIGSDAARALLLADLTGDDAAAAAGAAAGMTLLPALREAEERALFQAVRRGPGGDARRLALQALGVRGSAVNDRLMPAVLREVPRVFLAEQALLAAPDFQRRADQDLLRRYLSVGGRIGEFPARHEVLLLGPAVLGGRPAAEAAVGGGPQVSRAVRPAGASRNGDLRGGSLDDRGGPGGGNTLQDRGGPDGRNTLQDRGGPDGRNTLQDRGRPDGGNTLQDRGEPGGGNTLQDRGGPRGGSTLQDRGPRGRSDRTEADEGGGNDHAVPRVLVGGRPVPNPLEQRLETAAALGLARLEPSQDGFPEDAVEDLVEEIDRAGEPGSDPARAAMLLALGYLAAEEREGVPDLVLRYADGDEPDRDGLRLLRPRRVAASDPGPDAAELDRRATESFALLASAVLTRRVLAGPDAAAVYPLRLSPHDAARLRRDARRVFLKTAAQTTQPRGTRVAAAVALGLAGDRRDPGGGDALAPGGGLDLDPEALAAGDPLVLAALLGALETLAAEPGPGGGPAGEVEARVRARTDAFLAGIARGAAASPMSPLGVAAARRVVQSLAHRPAGVPVDAEALAALAEADPFLAVDAASASRWRSDPALAGVLLGRLPRPGPEGAAAAWALGALFDARCPSPLAELAAASNPLSLHREHATALLPLSRGSLAGGVTLFRRPGWWRDPAGVAVLDGWPGRDELAVSSPYLATRWDERLLGAD